MKGKKGKLKEMIMMEMSEKPKPKKQMSKAAKRTGSVAASMMKNKGKKC